MRSSPLRRSWCPSVLRPMPTGDGLLVRLRAPGNALSTSALHALAEGARRFGNGLIDLTSRGNLQIRGVKDETHDELVAHLARSGIIRHDVSADVATHIIASPLAGLREFGARLDIGAVVADVIAHLAEAFPDDALPSKFSIVIDDGGWPSLADIPAHLRFDAGHETGTPAFRVARNGTRDAAEFIDYCSAEDLAERIVRLARAAIDSKQADARPPTHAARSQQRPPIGVFHGTHEGVLVGLGCSFGRLTIDDLDLLAEACVDIACAELRVTPWRSVLLPIGKAERLANWRGRFAKHGFILDHDDPRLLVVACPGAPACRNATTATQADALRLAPLAQNLSRERPSLHVSGCVKGCACAQEMPITLVGMSGLYGIVRNGTAQDHLVGAPMTIEAAEAQLKHSILAIRS